MSSAAAAEEDTDSSSQTAVAPALPHSTEVRVVGASVITTIADRTASSSYRTSHQLALQFSCPVFTLCNIVKMISMSCKSQAEFFARSLQNKLQFLDEEGNSDEQQQGWLKKDIQSVVTREYPFLGTTFPPGRCAQFDLLRSKYHSESDLVPPSGSEDGRSMKTELEKGLDEMGDSDLFFDFDIGTPESEETQVPLHVINKTSPDREAHFGGGSVDVSDEDEDEKFTAPSTAYGSTSSGLFSDECGSTTGGIQIPQDDVDDVEGLSLDPSTWLMQNKKLTSDGSASSTPIAMASPPQTTSSPLISPDSVLDDSQEIEDKNPDSEGESTATEATEEETPTEDDAMEQRPTEQQQQKEAEPVPAETGSPRSDDDSTTPSPDGVTVFGQGPCEKVVANSKLTALLASLEKDRDYSSSRRSPTKELRSRLSFRSHRTCTAPIKDLTVAPSKEQSPEPSSPTKSIPFVHTSNSSPQIKAVSDDEALLSRTLPTRPAGVKPPPFLELPPSSLTRCDSTPVLTSLERSQIQAPSRKSFDTAMPAVEVEEDEDDEKPKLRKCLSLKSGKTPPGTPGRRKIVRFADLLGLDLADVKTFLDEVPRVPKSAFRDLKDAELSDIESDSASEASVGCRSPFPGRRGGRPMPAWNIQPNQVRVQLMPTFGQPGAMSNFFNVLLERKICLENAYGGTDRCSFKGTVRVHNIDFHKKVIIRYTTNEWQTSKDYEAVYMQGSCDGFSDKFTFEVEMPDLKVGPRVQFCLKYEAGGREFWDNNGGDNYTFYTTAAERKSSLPPVTPIGRGIKSSVPIPLGGQQRARLQAEMSTSPSAFTEDPWMQFA